MKTAEEVLGMPHVTLEAVEDVMESVYDEEVTSVATTDEDSSSSTMKNEKDPFLRTPPSVYDTVEASVKYSSYVIRQTRDMESWRRARTARIPPSVIYDRASLPSLSSEELEKLNAARPTTFAEASNISGVTPQSLVFLYHHVLRRDKEERRRTKVRDHERHQRETEGEDKLVRD